MKAIIQRVKKASVKIDSTLVGKIEQGLLVLIGLEKEDNKEKCEFAAKKIAYLRIFEDEFGKMNLNILETKGKILAVSQFTLAGSIKKGRRPSFDNAMKPELAKPLFEYFIEQLKEQGLQVETGKFQEYMEVSLINDGPVTFILEK